LALAKLFTSQEVLLTHFLLTLTNYKMNLAMPRGELKS